MTLSELKKIDESLYKKALKNAYDCEIECHGRTEEGAKDFVKEIIRCDDWLAVCFTWKRSPEGHDFWKKLDNYNLEDLEIKS